MLRSAVRESITEELESAAFEYGYKLEGEGEISVPAEGIASPPQTTMEWVKTHQHVLDVVEEALKK